MKFETSTAAHHIHKHFKNTTLVDEQCKFMCYSDSIFIYHLEMKKGAIYEICIIADTDFFPEMTFKDLMNLNRIEYLSINYFEKYELGKDAVNIGYFNINDLQHLN